MDKKCNGCQFKINLNNNINYGFCSNPTVNEKWREQNKSIFPKEKQKNISDDIIPSCLYVRSYIDAFCKEYRKVALCEPEADIKKLNGEAYKQYKFSI